MCTVHSVGSLPAEVLAAVVGFGDPLGLELLIIKKVSHFYVKKSAVCLVDRHCRDLLPGRLLGPILKESGFAFAMFLHPAQLDGLP